MEEMEEGMGDMMEYGDEEEPGEDSLNFEENPEYSHLPKLDKMRKIRREILRTINNVREAHKVNRIYSDPLLNQAANEYANYLMTNPDDDSKVPEICKECLIVGEVTPLVGFAILEEEEDHQGSLHDQMMDAHGLLLELEYELKILADKENTHIGVGFAFNKEVVKVVEFVGKKSLMVHQLNEAEDGGVDARGIVLDKSIGLYAARIVAKNKLNKDIKVVGPG